MARRGRSPSLLGMTVWTLPSGKSEHQPEQEEAWDRAWTLHWAPASRQRGGQLQPPPWGPLLLCLPRGMWGRYPRRHQVSTKPLRHQPLLPGLFPGPSPSPTASNRRATLKLQGRKSFLEARVIESTMQLSLCCIALASRCLSYSEQGSGSLRSNASVIFITDMLMSPHERRLFKHSP